MIDSYRASKRQIKKRQSYALPFSIRSLQSKEVRRAGIAVLDHSLKRDVLEGLTNIGCETNNQANIRANYVLHWKDGLCGALRISHNAGFMFKGLAPKPGVCLTLRCS